MSSFPTGDQNIDAWLLAKLPQEDFLQVLTLNKATSKMRNRDYIWFNRFIASYGQESFENVKTTMKRSWKDFCLLIIKYLKSSNYNKAMKLAAQGGHRDLVDFFISKGADDWDSAMHSAAEGGHRDLVDFFISKGVDDWNSAMKGAARGGHRDLVDFFISEGADNWNLGMFGATLGGHQELLDFFISKGADIWDFGMQGAAIGGHRELVDYFKSMKSQ